MTRRLAGFNLLRTWAPPPAPGRLGALAWLAGAACTVALLQAERQALDAAQAQADRLQSQLEALAPQLKPAQARAQALAARHAQAVQHEAAHAQLHRLLAVWQALAAAPGPRLTQLHWDAQGLLLHGQGQASQLSAWAAERASAVPGLGAAQLVELAALPPAPPSSPAPAASPAPGGTTDRTSDAAPVSATSPTVRFVLRFPEAGRP